MTKQERFRITMQRASRTLGGKLVVIAALLAALALIPQGANGQLGLDPCCAIISVGLKSISGLLQGVVAKPLAAIQQIEQQRNNFQHDVVFPAQAIASARGFAGQVQGQLRQLSQLDHLPINSATLPSAQQLEQSLLSRDPRAIASISQGYTALYGPVMAASDAPQPVRDIVDMTDAEAQAALKKAVEIDALADIEIAAADQINQQVQNAAPGSAPILEAEASAWLVRANAYTQSAMAELVRVRSIGLANSSAQLKFNTSHTNILRNAAGQILGRGDH